MSNSNLEVSKADEMSELYNLTKFKTLKLKKDKIF